MELFLVPSEMRSTFKGKNLLTGVIKLFPFKKDPFPSLLKRVSKLFLFKADFFQKRFGVQECIQEVSLILTGEQSTKCIQSLKAYTLRMSTFGALGEVLILALFFFFFYVHYYSNY